MSLFIQVTVPSTSIVTVLGMKQPSAVSSQPGVDEPNTFVTVAEVGGGVYSTTVMTKVLVPTFPFASSAVHVTVLSPTGNVAPDAGVHMGSTVTATLSVALTGNVATAPTLLAISYIVIYIR